MKWQRWMILLVVGLVSMVATMRAQTGQSLPPGTSATQNAKREGGKDDIQSIGSRKIGKGGLGNWYSLEQEIGMGREYSKAVEDTSKFVEDPVVIEYVNRVGQNLVRNSDAQVPFTIKVIDSQDINAFALPGGFLFVNSGIVLAAQDEAELAGVMAHEIAHVAARHATRQMTRSQILNLASIPLIFVGGGIGLAVREAIALGVPLSMTKFSRNFEAEADYLGVEYMYRAGYDPQAFIAFFERVQAQEKQKPGFITKAFASHPQTTDRIHKTQQEIANILPERDAYVISTSDFEEVRARLTDWTNRHSINSQGSTRPTLRRRSGDESDPDQHDSDDDQHPTLRRRHN